ncbi:pyruvate dehydrogenase complex dihydrolipoamide acetyltransferase [Pseudaquidulcibacter saccharophilus]|uniref:pyruvate dehydrogenase complex dihydrolipoamide acetyltransferase n=1 Tax=Pseudaquidulcibacter saccharophilus TaxID=2831900 RepID=UPI001EFF3C61|nr:pyruvate dehydrogenase complex dihydrolipoamide acetyltransferase [Pseudaquidulcibacter saccharophilus]
MPVDILMPALSPTMEEGVLAKWLVKVGDEIKSGDVIAEIETDKATMEVEAVDEGEVLEILVPEGTSGVKINTVIARISGDDASPAKPAPAAPQVASAPAAEAAKPAAAPQPVAVAKTDAGERIFASPLARRIAAQNNVDLKTIKGTGPNGRIVRVDVEGVKGGAAAPATAAVTPAAPVATQAAKAPSTIAATGYKEGNYDVIPLDGMRRTIAKRLTDSFRDVPHFPLNVDIELDKLLELRKQLNSQNENAKISVNDMIIKATALACKKVPEANASYTDEGILIHHHADVAVAVAIDGGLITPVVREAENKGLLTISEEVKTLADKAKNRKLMPEEYSAGTISVSNLGMFGIKSFGSIINEPQGCILSVGAGEQRPVVKDGALAIATVMSVTLTCDHRVVDGAVGAKWLKAFKRLLEEPLSMLL